MLSKIPSFGILGVQAYPVEIEVDIYRGLPITSIVGLADAAIKESRERVRSAIKNSGFDWPAERITINLAPSDIKKDGASFDLAIAIGILSASGQINICSLDKFYFFAELSLDGALKPIKAVLPISAAIMKSGVHSIILPVKNTAEASLVKGLNIYPAKSLAEVVEFLNNQNTIAVLKDKPEHLAKPSGSYSADFSEVKGQFLAKRAIEVAVSGGHNIAMIGPPGCGKTMLAKRIPSIMTDLTNEEMLEVMTIHSVKGLLQTNGVILSQRPFRSPHHTVSDIALTGGGSFPQPGEISLAHRGILFLDELPEFRRNVLETLRQPLEDGHISICRAAKSLRFPASFMLVVTMNPCPCGYLTDPNKVCRCNTKKIDNYIGKISGPLLDRIDIHIELPPIRYQELTDTRESESSAKIKERVNKALILQKERLKNEDIHCNAQMSSKLTRKYCRLNSRCEKLIELAITELGLSARAYDKILKVSRTVADIAQSDETLEEHISEAIEYRSLDKRI